MKSRAPSRRGAALAGHQRRASAIATRPKSCRLRRIGRVALYCAISFTIGSIVLVALYRALPPPGTPLMLIRRIEGYGIDKSWRRLDDISPHLIRAAMAGEDARFCRHHGFDWGAIATAWDRYQSGHGRLLGASTISMQTAKNVFLWPGRDWLRKGFEAWFTALIELAWGKRRIMEIYLNVVEWGPGVYGAEAAAQYYFHKPAGALNPVEAVRLAATLPDPLGWSPRRPGRRLLARGAASARTCRASPRRCPCPAGREGRNRVFASPSLPRRGTGVRYLLGWHISVVRGQRGRRAGESLSPRPDLSNPPGDPGLSSVRSALARTRVREGSQAADRLCADGHH